jgi:osmotically-inducible protein OsmY
MKARKVMYPVALMAAAVALLVITVPASAAQTTDERIESSAKASYVFKTYLKDDAITIASKDGAVTLTGTVNEDYHKILAKETVADLPGVTSVDNRLELKGESPPENSDAWVKAKVMTTLLFHRNVSGIKTDVHVQEGIVTLRGEATSQAQKDLTTEYVKDVVGVKDVKNEMTAPKIPGKSVVKKMGDKISDVGEKIDDASVTALVKTTLLFHRSTSALNTKVVTRDGAVTLSGKAKNASEKDLATKFVEDVHGVKSVKNQMTIE